MNYVFNLTKTDLVVLGKNGCPFKFKSLGRGMMHDIPAEKKGVFYVVSKAVQRQYPERNDLVIAQKPIFSENGEVLCFEKLKGHRKAVAL